MTGTDPEGEREEPGRSTDPDDAGPELDYDAAFAALIAQFERDAPSEDGPGDRSEDRPEDQPEDRPDDLSRPSGSAADRPGPHRADHTDRAAEEPWYPPELDEHFEPPDPGPLPRGDRVSRAAWAGLLGGPLLLLIAALLRGALPSWMVLLALAAFVGGFVTLIVRMPADRPDDDDNGAVV